MTRMVFRRLPVCLALLIGVLVAAWHPVLAMEAAGAERASSRSERAASAARLPRSTPVAVTLWRTAGHAAPAPLMERLPQERRHPSWHRNAARRVPRGQGGGQLSLPTNSGSVPTPLLLYTQQLEWHVLPLPLVHGVGGRSAPPRAPPR